MESYFPSILYRVCCTCINIVYMYFLAAMMNLHTHVKCMEMKYIAQLYLCHLMWVWREWMIYIWVRDICTNWSQKISKCNAFALCFLFSSSFCMRERGFHWYIQMCHHLIAHHEHSECWNINFCAEQSICRFAIRYHSVRFDSIHPNRNNRSSGEQKNILKIPYSWIHDHDKERYELKSKDDLLVECILIIIIFLTVNCKLEREQSNSE